MFFSRTMPSSTSGRTLQYFMIAIIFRNDSAEIGSKEFTKKVLTDLTIHLSGYNQLQSVSRKLSCAQQCSRDDACADFYYTSIEHICYLNDDSSTNVYTIQTANYVFYESFVVPVGCPVNEGGWFVLEEGSNVMFSLFTTTAMVRFQDAVDHCASHDSHPLQILTNDKMIYVREKLMPCPEVKNHNYWIDATNAQAANPSALDAFRTTDNKVFPINESHNWYHSDGPNDGNVKPLCIWLFVFYQHKFDDIPCYSPTGNIKVVCERFKS